MAFPIQAQWRGVLFDELGQKDGFLARGVYDIYKIAQGTFISARSLGLVRYDGSEFEYFRHDPQDTNSISDGHVRCLAVDDDGFIWMGLSGSIDRFDPRTASFIHYPIKDFPYEGNEIRIDILSISIDGEEFLWLGGGMLSLHRFTRSNGSVKSYFPDGMKPLRPAWTGKLARVWNSTRRA